jgi:3-isopropylmalate dehydrogenase
MTQTFLLMGGDGIGPEVVAEARRVLGYLIERDRLDITIDERPYGAAEYQATGKLISDQTLDDLMDVDAVLFGATGGPDMDAVPREARAAGSLLRIRKQMDVFANLRPVRVPEALLDVTPLKPEKARGVDLIIVRELTSGLYFGQPKMIEDLGDGRRRGVDTQTYTSDEIHRVARAAFELARRRSGRVTSVDKSNVMESGKLWRQEVTAIGQAEYKDVALEHILGDNCGMQLVLNPGQFDVLLADNMFGDILSDVAAGATGSLGMLPSASLSAADEAGGSRALYEPVHGSAPDIAGQGIANPAAAILSVALAFRHSFGLDDLADEIVAAVDHTLGLGIRTPDICPPDREPATTTAFTDAVIAAFGANR